VLSLSSVQIIQRRIHEILMTNARNKAQHSEKCKNTPKEQTTTKGKGGEERKAGIFFT
jgi:hypothetical protein